MKRLLIIMAFSAIMFTLVSCGNQPSKEPGYEQTKQMMIDTLQTDEGRKALLDIISDDKLKQHLIIDSEVVKETISETLVSKEGKEMWKQLFADPKFLESFHTSIADEQEKMFKHLMNDAEFQKQMLELLQNPEMDKQTLKLLKSQQFREHLEKTIAETIENPVYRAKLQKELGGDSKDEEGGKSKEEEKGKEDEKSKEDEGKDKVQQ